MHQNIRYPVDLFSYAVSDVAGNPVSVRHGVHEYIIVTTSASVAP